MKGITGIDGLDWILDKATIINKVDHDPNIPIMDHAVQIQHTISDTTTVQQTLSIPTDVETVTLSFYADSNDIINGGDENLFLAELVDSVTGTRFGEPILIAGTTAWTQYSNTISLPPSRNSIVLRLKLNGTTGTIRLTCIKIEEGYTH